MNGISTEKLLLELRQITQENIRFVQKKCSHYGQNQMDWRPSQYAWSINEILSHLIAYSEFYHKTIRAKFKKTKHRTPLEYFVSSQLGRSSWKSMKIGRANNIKRKYRATRAYNPTLNPSLLDSNALENFIKKQEDFLELLEESAQFNLKKVKVITSFGKVIRLRLGDVLMFVTYHSERHIQQLKNVISHPNFPKKQS